MPFKDTVKALRVAQPFNAFLTSFVKTVLKVSGLHSEWVIMHLPRSGITRVKLPNGRFLRLWSQGDDWISTQIFWRGWDRYEPETVPLFYRLAQRSRVVFDVGSHIGYFSFLAALGNRRSQVYAFEPHPIVHHRLRQNTRVNHLKNVHCIQKAASDNTGTAQFFHVAAGLPSSSSLSSEFMEQFEGVQSSAVEVIMLDDFVREHDIDRVDLMKLDTECTEPQVLRGMQETLRRDRPHIVCEVLPGSDTGEPLQEILEPLGYHFYLLTAQGPAVQTRIHGHEAHHNYLFSILAPNEVAGL